MKRRCRMDMEEVASVSIQTIKRTMEFLTEQQGLLCLSLRLCLSLTHLCHLLHTCHRDCCPHLDLTIVSNEVVKLSNRNGFWALIAWAKAVKVYLYATSLCVNPSIAGTESHTDSLVCAKTAGPRNHEHLWWFAFGFADRLAAEVGSLLCPSLW